MAITGVSLPLMKTLNGSAIQKSLILAAGGLCTYEKDSVWLLAIPALSKLSVPYLAAPELTAIDVHLK
jgi:hypothetical protein